MTRVITFSLVNDKADVHTSEVRYLHDGARLKLNIRGHQAAVLTPLLGDLMS